jgi:hypothetical protein
MPLLVLTSLYPHFFLKTGTPSSKIEVIYVQRSISPVRRRIELHASLNNATFPGAICISVYIYTSVSSVFAAAVLLLGFSMRHGCT